MLPIVASERGYSRAALAKQGSRRNEKHKIESNCSKPQPLTAIVRDCASFSQLSSHRAYTAHRHFDRFANDVNVCAAGVIFLSSGTASARRDWAGRYSRCVMEETDQTREMQQQRVRHEISKREYSRG